MKKFISIGLMLSAIFAFTGCNKSGNGELTGVQGRGKWFEPTPLGMTFIHRGSLNIGPNDQDITWSNTPTKTVSVDAFWMDDTEITNNEYRQFVYWVRDSIARTYIAEQYPEFLISEDRDGNPLDQPRLNWREKLEWNNPDYTDALEQMFIPENERFFRKKEIDARKLFYEYHKIDYKQAARRANMYDYKTQSYNGTIFNENGEEVPIQNRSSFIKRYLVDVYPDTLCWIRDFTYSYNEPWATRYFWHPGFDDYPVVGVDWEQANAFCSWRTKIQNEYLASRNEATLQDYELPSEVQWEYAARGDLKLAMYPWGGYYTRDQEGVFLANFKPLRGNYAEDGGIATMKVGSYDPNEFGLYDMAGNVAEWTKSAYDESSYMYFNDFNPDFTYNALPTDAPALKRKVIRGGSWKDIAAFVQVSTRSYEYQDTTKSYIGFRCVRASFGNEF
ncbi:MAG: SUMF1/EgtB/PvdO family nonheme iron enzyme [Prolixibacteraceae bacterium]|jgi:gliding motility-associated lipoprotein GldK|nr:SUMF1/EgtB/PvdO family nonheme iron enzyme [Prolixibacteraceae bacterium]